MLRELIETILKESKTANEQKSADIIGEIFNQKLPEALEELANGLVDSEGKYEAQGSAGTPGMNALDKLGYLPLVYLYDLNFKENDKFNSDPYYLIYILREDRKGVYLSLSHNQEYMKKILEEKHQWDSWFGGKLQTSLIEEVSSLREKIGEIPSGFSKIMKLGSIHAKSGKMYESASVFSKYYTLDNMPSEEEMINDLKNLLDIYGKVMDLKPKPKIWKIAPGNKDKRQKFWPILKEKGYIGVGYFGCDKFTKIDYSGFNSINEIKDVLKDCFNLDHVGNNPNMIWDFGREIQIGDYIIANDGKKGILGIGIIRSEYITPIESETLNLDPDGEYFHFRKVDWIITDPIKMNENEFFAIQTVAKVNWTKWNKIKETYIKKAEDYKRIFEEIELGKLTKIENSTKKIKPQKIIMEFFNDFNKDYLSINEGQDHLNAYSDASKRFKNKLNEIEIKKNQNKDTTDDILYGLVPLKGRDIVGFMADTEAYFEKKLKIDPQNFPAIADTLYKLIKDLDVNNNSKKQRELITNFAESEYSRGFGAATLSPTLFFINHKYPLINSKTKITAEFLSKIIKKPIIIYNSLTEYINDKKSLERLILELSEYVPNFSNFAIFDIFCHWMCEEKLGNYANDDKKYEKWFKNKFGNAEIDYDELDSTALALHPGELDIKLKLNSRTLDQVCGTLNAGKHIMLTGAPGTGKTDLAESVCEIASSLNFTEGYILTTATSDWTTFDTIGGYMPDETGKLYFEEGKFLQSIRENKWLIIDEINRADIDKAFGQLFTVLSGQGVELPYKNNGESFKIKRGDKNKSYYSSEDSTYYVGKNWRILATMNVYDKDYLFEMSYAFMRRFTFIYIDLPDENDFKELINSWCDGLEPYYVDSIHNLLEINEYRQIGPAIFKDISEYIKERKKIGNADYILNDAVLSYILPQFEGLEKIKVVGIWKILQEIFEENDELKIRLEEIATVKLDES